MCGLLVIFLSVLILELVDAAVPAQLLDRQTINQVEDVRVVIGSFIPGYQQEEKPKKQRSEFAPTISPIPAANHVYAGSTDAIYTGTMRSITPASYHGINGSAGNFVNGPTILAAQNNISLPREGHHPVVAAENSISMAGDGQTVMAAENNLSKPGESEKLGPKV